MYNTDMPTRAELPTTRQLLRSTLIAGVTASVLLVTFVLPAEYAVDPTGVGKVLGLTQMGEIKQQLAAEAAADVVTDMGGATDAAQTPSIAAPLPADTAATPDVVIEPAVPPDQPVWRDVVTLILAPDEATEVKLIMMKGDTASYAWSVDRGHLNSDLHGDGTQDQSTSYRKGRAEAADTGELTAAFDGAHGWFWRNRSDVPVELTLQANGVYSEVKRVF